MTTQDDDEHTPSTLVHCESYKSDDVEAPCLL